MLLDAQLHDLGPLAAERPGQSIGGLEREVVRRGHRHACPRAIGQVDSHGQVASRTAERNVDAPRGGLLGELGHLVFRSRLHAQVHRVVQGQGVHDGVRIVVAVRAARADGQ